MRKNILLENIFQHKKQKVEKELVKQKIIIDYREKNSLVPSELVNLGFNIEFTELKVADYLIKDVAIERKTVSDFISSMLNKRLIKQLEEIQQYKTRFLIIEGIEEQELYSDEGINGVNPNSIRGFIISIIMKYNTPIIYTKNSSDTAKFISVITKRLNKADEEISLNISKKSLSKSEKMQYILEGFPGIGPKNAKKLLKKFKTIKEIINAPQEELIKSIGKKAEIFKIVDEEY
ncbi:MAG: ERCC4 domain-containing protein [Nanoarchaeota archaeon]